MDGFIDVGLLLFLLTIAIAACRAKNLFEAAMLFGIFSLVSASFFVVLDAADVAPLYLRDPDVQINIRTRLYGGQHS